MFLISILLLFSGSVSMVSFYLYQKEKRGLRQFMQQSRRHSYHKTVDVAIQKKATRHLILSITFLLVSILIVWVVVFN